MPANMEQPDPHDMMVALRLQSSISENSIQ